MAEKKSPPPKVKKSKSGLDKRGVDLLAVAPAPFAEAQTAPTGVVPLFLATKTQELFDLRADADVTSENPYKLIKKADILVDLQNRAAICDFHPVKQSIIDFPSDEILVVYDADFMYGQNFYVAITEDAKETLLSPEVEDDKDDEEDMVQHYVPPVSKPWVHLGSDAELREENINEHRLKVAFSIRRQRREFGAPIAFKDRNVVDAKDGYIECTPYEDKTFELKKMELDKSIQAIRLTRDLAVQTDWKRPRNAAVQYEARQFPENERLIEENSPALAEFLRNIAPRFELALQQNEILDVFFDDWANLTDDDGTFGSKADNHLKEFQSFTDLQFSKERTITCIDWHPTIKGIVAVSVGERLSFDDRIDHAHKIVMAPSLILVWSFSDPIHPQLLMEAPDDIMCFKFCPTDPNIVAGGCINGQVVMWDISKYAERLKQSRSGKSKQTPSALAAFENSDSQETPIMRYCAVSSIEHSHRFPITDLQWVPDHFEITRMGVPQENKVFACSQIMTCATDHTVLVWDIRPMKGLMHMLEEKPKEETKGPLGIPTTFKHLDLVWKPHLKISLSKSEPGGDHAPTKFTISEIQGDRSALAKIEEEEKTDKKQNPTQTRRTLKSVKTSFYVGTEDGEIVYVDWMPQKDSESGKIQTPKPEYYHMAHGGPVVTLQRSPFFRDVILCVGGWTFSIWKEGVTTGPLLRSSASTKRFTAGHWSLSRPAVFYITKQDGSIDIWDLLDRTHEACISQSVSPSPITCIYPFQVTNKQHLMAIGDSLGTLHILTIPWSLRQPTPNEQAGMANYIEREVKRRAFVMARWEFRKKKKVPTATLH